jgi:hypothetical protein
MPLMKEAPIKRKETTRKKTKRKETVGFGAIRRRSYTPEEGERPWIMLERGVAL